MFFKRRNKEKPAEAADTPEADKKKDSKAADAGRAPSLGQGISADTLRRSVEASSLGFKTTADLEPEDGRFGQERALADLDFGLKMRGRDFNIFVLGPRGTGKKTAVLAHLANANRGADAPPDWVYVQNFEDAHRLRALKLPSGRAPFLAERVAAAIAELRSTLPAAFDAEDFRVRHRAIEEDYRSARDDALDALHLKAAEQNIAVLRTPLGFGMAPMHDGQVVKPEVFNQLPQVMRRDVESRVVTLQSELETLLASAPEVDRERRRQIAALNAETARHPVEAALDDISQTFADVPDVTAFLADVERDLVTNAQAFLSPAAQEACVRRYDIHVAVTHVKDAGAPVVHATDLSPRHLIGDIGPAADAGVPITGRRRILPGSLHKANGGTLLITARRLVDTQDAWGALKRALETGAICLGSASGDDVGLDADPIPLDAKIVLIGSSDDYDRLLAADPDFGHFFKVQARFEQTAPRSAVNDNRLARLTASIVKTHALKPFDAGAVARLIEDASRIAGHRDTVSLNIGRIADLARAADFWSKHAGRDVTTADDVARAIKKRTQRTEALHSLPIRTDAARAGQVIALGTSNSRGVRFGQAHRICARVHAGRGRVADIVCDGASGGGYAHMLAGYLAATLTPTAPLALASAIIAEPPLPDEASSGAPLAVLLALLSALADQTLRQDLAVAGLVNPWGDVQPVEGINEQVESFFDASRGSLSATPGVLIPEGNRAHLMLREDVVEAVSSGRFVIHAVTRVDEALGLMTDRETGAPSADVQAAADAVKVRAAAKLRAFADALSADKVAAAREGRA